jgi:hypothetical protein
MTLLSDLEERMSLGKSRYGHGVRVNDDTRTWGTKQNSWNEMAREELLDAIIYVVADYIREYEIPGDNDDNFRIMEIITDYKTQMVDGNHKLRVRLLIDLMNI